MSDKTFDKLTELETQVVILQNELAKEKARSESLGAVLSYAVNMITQMASVIEIRGRLPEMFKKTHDKYHKLAHLVIEWYKGESDPRLICEEAKRLKNTPESEW